MGEKDMTEKKLESLSDVFADIVNVLLFDGERLISPESLTDASEGSIYKADGGVYWQERDVAKHWLDGTQINIATLGLENQTKIEKLFPARVISYDGADYRFQLRRNDEIVNTEQRQSVLYPVVTLVLYFGIRKWKASPHLIDCLNVPDKLKPYVSDYKINLFQIAYLDDQTVQKFQSDFRSVAQFFVDKRKNKRRRTGSHDRQRSGASTRQRGVRTDESSNT